MPWITVEQNTTLRNPDHQTHNVYISRVPAVGEYIILPGENDDHLVVMVLHHTMNQNGPHRAAAWVRVE